MNRGEKRQCSQGCVSPQCALLALGFSRPQSRIRTNQQGYRGKRAFTLLELLFVILILALLAAVLMSALSLAKTRSQRLVCGSNLHQMGIALRIYVDDSRGVFPYVTSIPFANARGFSCWFDALATTIPGARWGEGIFKCPAYLGVGYAGESALNSDGGLTAVYYPCGSYAYNAMGRRKPIAGQPYLISADLGFGIADGKPLTEPIRENHLRAPADLYVLGDSPLVTGLWGPAKTTRLGGAADYNGFAGDMPFFEYAQHPTAFNMLFADTHVANVRTEVLLGTNDFSRSRWNRDHCRDNQ